MMKCLLCVLGRFWLGGHNQVCKHEYTCLCYKRQRWYCSASPHPEQELRRKHSTKCQYNLIYRVSFHIGIYGDVQRLNCHSLMKELIIPLSCIRRAFCYSLCNSWLSACSSWIWRHKYGLPTAWQIHVKEFPGANNVPTQKSLPVLSKIGNANESSALLQCRLTFGDTMFV